MKTKFSTFFLILFSLIFLITACSPDTPDPGKEPMEEGTRLIKNFSSFTDGKSVVFKWDYTCDDVSRVEVEFITTEGTEFETHTVLYGDTPKITLYGKSDKIYQFSFTPYSKDNIKGHEETGSRIIHQSIFDTGLPRIEIETEDHVWPTFDYVEHPEGAIGLGITNNEYVKCSVKLIDSEGTILNKEDNYLSTESKIRIRGNTSAYSEISPYKIKLNKKEDLLGLATGSRSDSKYKDKNWLLLNNARLLKTVIGLASTELMGFEFVPAYSFVDVYVNGDYRGIYLLIENVKEGATRCNIADDGFVFENDAYWWNEPLYFTTDILKKKFTFKYPDPDEITQNQIDYLKSYLNDAEKALKTADDSYLDYYDVDTFVSWAMVHEYLGTIDGGGTNQFFIKKDSSNDSKIEMTTPWDFDGIIFESEVNKQSNVNSLDYALIMRMMRKQSFKNLFCEKYQNTKNLVIDFICNKINNLNSEAINESRLITSFRWGTPYVKVEEQKEEIELWLEQRIDWMNTRYTDFQ